MDMNLEQNNSRKRFNISKIMNNLFVSLFVFILFLIMFASTAPVHARDEEGGEKESPWRFEQGGYLTTLWTFAGSENNSPAYTLNTNRFRYKPRLFYKENLSLSVTYDLEMYTGNIVSSPFWKLIKNDQDGAYWNLASGTKSGDAVYFRHALHRVYITYDAKFAKAVLGKQRIAWGAMRFWRPTDLFNPESPLQIESGERTGVDAVRITAPLGDGTGVEAVYAPSRFAGIDSKALKLRHTIGDYDVELVGGEVRGHDLAGISFDGYIGDGGFRGEIVRLNPPMADPYYQWAVGGDYTFPGPLTVTMEYLENGGATGQPVNSILFTNQGFLTTKNRRFLSAGLQYQIDPLFNTNSFISYDLDGESFVFTPRMTWNYIENVDINLGFQFYGGTSDKGEYTNNPYVIYSQLKYYF